MLETGYVFGGHLETILPDAAPPISPRPEPHSDAHWMREAFLESLKGVGISSPNPAVGCVLVKGGQEIARGHTQRYGGKHAERMAFEQASARLENLRLGLEGATAYVTLEPCSHFGHQPPCVELLLASTIRRVVIGRADPNPLVNGEGIRRLREAGKEVEIGPMHEEISALNFPFFAENALKRPVVALKWAQTLDGQLADDAGRSRWISGPTSRAYSHWLRRRADAVLVGAGTALADLPALNARDCWQPEPKQPMKIIFDPRGRCLSVEDPDHQDRIRTTTFASGTPLVLLTSRNLLERKSSPFSRWMQSQSHLLILTEDAFLDHRPAVAALDRLAGAEVREWLGRPLQSILVEGGPATLTEFIRAGLADVLHSFIAPVLTGGERFRISPAKLLADDSRYSTIAQAALGPDALLEMVPETLAERIFI